MGRDHFENGIHGLVLLAVDILMLMLGEGTSAKRGLGCGVSDSEREVEAGLWMVNDRVVHVNVNDLEEADESTRIPLFYFISHFILQSIAKYLNLART